MAALPSHLSWEACELVRKAMQIISPEVIMWLKPFVSFPYLVSRKKECLINRVLKYHLRLEVITNVCVYVAILSK